ncbi:MAG: hypothetical protein WBQ86_12875, partial [Candidatus Binatus sp.]
MTDLPKPWSRIWSGAIVRWARGLSSIVPIRSAPRAFVRPELMVTLMIVAATLATPSIAGEGIADVVLGQANFMYYVANFPDAQKLDNAQGVAI